MWVGDAVGDASFNFIVDRVGRARGGPIDGRNWRVWTSNTRTRRLLSLFKAQLSSFRRNCVAGRQFKSRFELLTARWRWQIDRVGQRDG
jgi:hypothetical protein